MCTQGRRNYRSLRGLIRLQGVVRGASVRRQTAHAMRCMQTLVRVQAQVRASRVEAMERRNGRHHGAMLRDGWRRAGSQDGVWDESLLSRDEADARTKRKVEAVIKRERALAYAYSHQVRTYTHHGSTILKHTSHDPSRTRRDRQILRSNCRRTIFLMLRYHVKYVLPTGQLKPHYLVAVAVLVFFLMKGVLSLLVGVLRDLECVF